MAETNRQSSDDGEELEPRRSNRDGMRRRSLANARSRQRRSGPTKFNGIHRRRSKRSSW